MNDSTLEIPRGLTMLVAPAEHGKSRLLERLAGDANGVLALLDEPLDASNLHWVNLASTEDLIDSFTATGEGATGGDESAARTLTERLAPLIGARPWFVDSFRGLMFEGGAAMRGGLSSQALVSFTRLHNLAFRENRPIVGTLNSVYPADSDLHRLLVEHVSGSVGTTLTATAGSAASSNDFFTKRSTSVRAAWTVYRSREESSSLQEFLNVYNQEKN